LTQQLALAVKKEVSFGSQVKYGEPQGSVLGPLPFLLYMGDIIKKHDLSFH